MTLTIKTNHHWRAPVYGYELTAAERADFDYIDFDSDDGACHDFMRYRGCTYDLSEFMRIPQSFEHEWSKMMTWHGYQSDSFFSGIVIRWSDDFEEIQVGTYMS